MFLFIHYHINSYIFSAKYRKNKISNLVENHKHRTVKSKLYNLYKKINVMIILKILNMATIAMNKWKIKMDELWKDKHQS